MSKPKTASPEDTVAPISKGLPVHPLSLTFNRCGLKVAAGTFALSQRR